MIAVLRSRLRLALPKIIAGCCAWVAVGLLGGAPALAVRGHVFASAFGSLGSGNGQFLEPEGVAVGEASGDVYVVDKGNDRVERFSASGQFKGQFDGSGKYEVEGKAEVGTPAGFGGRPEEIETGKFSTPEGIAVDNDPASPSYGDVYVIDTGHGVVDKFAPDGAYLGQLPGLGGEFAEPESFSGVGVDRQGNVWVGFRRVGGPVFEYNGAEPNEAVLATGARIPGHLNLPGFAVDSEDDLYVHSSLEPGVIAKFDHEENVLDEELDTEPASAIATELSSDDVYVDNIGSLVRFDSHGAQLERLALAGSSGAGVSVDSESETLYVAQSAADDIEVFAPESPSVPAVLREAVSTVTGESATLEAEINPQGASTTYHFEYGPCPSLDTCAGSAYGTSVPQPDVAVGATFASETVTPVNVQGLTANTAYHFRVAAHNEHGTTYGLEATFTTQTVGPLVLPDEREWELVSPPDKHGALIEPDGYEASIQAAAGGGELVFAADAPTETEPVGYAAAAQVLAVREANGWSSRDITIPHETATRQPSGSGTEFRLFSSDLSHAIVQPLGNFVACQSEEGLAQPCLSTEASQQTAFLATSYAGGDPRQPCPAKTAGCYQPLVTAAAGVANVPPGTPFGEEGHCAGSEPKGLICGPEFVDATPNLSHVVLESHVPLTTPSGGDLYEWSAAEPPAKQLAPVSVLPEGGGPASGALLGFNDQDVRGAISADGRRVFWSTGTSSKEPGPLYVRDVVKGETLELSTFGEFQDASSDGSRAFYLEGGVLFECHIVEGAGGKSECEGESEHIRTELGSGVLGAIPGASEDGSWVYFVATNALAAGAQGGEPNLYVRHEGTTKLIAVLSGEDHTDWSGANISNLATMTSRVSPDGDYFAFMSNREQKGYDNRDAVSGKRDEEVYLYDGPTGTLVCASCNPSGARPVGEEAIKTSRKNGGLAGSEGLETSVWLAADVPAWSNYRLEAAVYQPNYLSDSGRLYFNARDPLVAQASGGSWDVYEFEPSGRGSCHAGGSGFSERTDGCVALISGGGSDRESAFLDASEDGGDVFFLTTAKLSLADKDESIDVYDAHECTSQAPCFAPAAVPAPACTNEASCRPAPTPQPPIFQAPASATFSGPGNASPPASPTLTTAQRRAKQLAAALKTCRRKHARGLRAACERAARRKYGSAKKASKQASGASRAGKPRRGA